MERLMKLGRNVLGLLSLLAIAVGMNLAVLRESVFSTPVLLPMAVGVGAGVLWLILTLFSALSRRSSNTMYAVNAVISSILFLVICVTLYAFVKRSDLSWDLTQEGRRELAPQTRLVLQSITEDVDVYCLFVKAGEERVRLAQEKTRRFLERCQTYSDHLNVEFIDPETHPERVEMLNVMRISTVGTIVMKSGTNQREIPLSNVNARLEERDFTNVLINVSRDSVPKVYFLDGHGGRDIDDKDPLKGASTFKLILRQESYDVAKCSIPADQPALPKDCTVLVIDHYTSDLLPYEIQVLNQFVADGGRLMILLNPAIKVEDGGVSREQLRPWLLNTFGVRVVADVIASPVTNSFKTIMFLSDYTQLGDAAAGFSDTGGFRGSFNATHPITRNFDQQMVWPFVRTVLLENPLPAGVTGDILLRTTPDTWGETNIGDNQSGQPLKPDPNEIKGPNPVAVAVTRHSDTPTMEGDRSRDARLVVIGNADMAVNENIKVMSNADFVLNSMAWLTETEDLIAIRPSGQENQPLILTQTQQRSVAWLASLGAVQVIALLGVAAYLMRRRHQ
jgi:gliding motility-associatede transport system auxiliary component